MPKTGFFVIKMRLLLLILVLGSCSRPLYIKDRYFDCKAVAYTMDSDLKQLIYKTLKRATVDQKDIPDYRLMWKKHRIYVLNEYQTNKTHFVSIEDWNQSLSFLQPGEIPNQIENVSYCLKSKAELQQIADRSREDFLFLSFNLIKIETDQATVQINNSWMVSKHHKNVVYLSGGGYTCHFIKRDGQWYFDKISSRWIS